MMQLKGLVIAAHEGPGRASTLMNPTPPHPFLAS